MAADIGHIAQLLDATLDPQQHKKGIVVMPSPVTAPTVPGTHEYQRLTKSFQQLRMP